MVFCNIEWDDDSWNQNWVTILILIDGFLQLYGDKKMQINLKSHNPYFNRWFSAMSSEVIYMCNVWKGHNPYFNRWFSAIMKKECYITTYNESQSLF